MPVRSGLAYMVGMIFSPFWGFRVVEGTQSTTLDGVMDGVPPLGQGGGDLMLVGA